MSTAILDQLARSGLLPESLSAAILAGDVPPTDEIVTALVIGAMDSEAMARAGRLMDWAERRLSRQLLTIVFLTVIAAEQGR
jgi:hypothetical protein